MSAERLLDESIGESLSESTEHDQTNAVDERRSKSDNERDRRVIARISNPEMRPMMLMLRQLCRAAVTFAVVYVAALVLGHLLPTPNWQFATQSLFLAVVVAMLAFNFGRLAKAITSYLENESKGRLATVVERTMHLVFVAVTLGAILGAVHIITWIK